MFKKTLLISSAALLSSAMPAFAQSVDDEIIVTATKRSSTLQETPVAVTVTSGDVIEKAQILDIKDLQSVVPTFRVSQLQNSANTTLTIRGFGNGGNNIGIEPAVGLFIDGVYRSRAAAQISDLPALERVEVLSGPQSTLFGKNASAGVVSIVTEKPQFETAGYVEGGLGRFDQHYLKGYITGAVGENTAVSLGGGFQKRDGYFTNFTSTAGDMNNIDRFNLRGQVLFQPTDALELRVIADMSNLKENCCGTGVAIEGPLNGVAGPRARDVVNALGGGMPSADSQFTYGTQLNRDTINDIDDRGISAQIDYDFGGVTLTSISAYRTNESYFSSDSDFTSLESLKDTYQGVEINTLTQELRLASNGGNQLEWMVGGYYFDESIEQNSGIIYGADLRNYVDALSGNALNGVEDSLGLARGTFFADGQQIIETFTQDDKAYSIFGSADFHATDRLTFTVGANYTKDKKNVAGSTVNDDVFSNVDFQGAAGLQVLTVQGLAANFPALAASCGLGPLPFSQANVGAVLGATCVVDTMGTTAPGSVVYPGFQAQVAAGAAAIDRTSLDASVNPLAALYPLQFQPQFLAYPNSVESGKTNDDELTYTAKVGYEVSDNINTYASYATGFKASSWNLTRDSRPFLADAAALSAAGLLPNNYVPSTGRNFGTRFAEPETVEVFELGLKGRFEKGAFNVALFDQTVEGFQSTIFQGTGFVLDNAGSQSTKGIEFDTTYSPVEALTLTFAGVIQDPVYDSFVGAQVSTGSAIDLADGVADGSGDLSGEKPAGINEIALSASATYTHQFENGLSGFIRGNYQYEDAVQIVDNIEGITRDTKLVNASAGLNFDNGLEIRYWVANLFNHETYTSAFPGVLQAGTVNGYPNQPRTYGVAMRYSF
ncbi:TonB-dependent receptor-like protein [Litorimonas taeanensis]|uniref:TonB-dependent receptor-like protein n=1 Tax=Litorimonas taeanensis TaxID=568099 RepID=A0A420WK48_9PROT|nr:TonB-dependent receptor [Litorimonas taeanensis]RKQ71292.1 TonB-dependent receptor-like protein [Litorimonas taeanensis]